MHQNTHCYAVVYVPYHNIVYKVFVVFANIANYMYLHGI